MYGDWTEYVVSRTILLGFIWDMSNMWICFENRFFKLLHNDDKKMLKKFYSKLISCLGKGWESKN